MVLHSLATLVGGRARFTVFELLLDRFVPCVVGKNTFKKRLDTNPVKDNDLFTVSDEAFMLLILENSYERWVDIFDQQDPNSGAEIGKRKGREWKWASSKHTRYTQGGIRYARAGGIESSGGTKGWSREGKDRYIKLYQMVLQDRRSHPEAFQRWIKQFHAESSEIKIRPSASETWDVEMESDLFESLGIETATVEEDSLQSTRQQESQGEVLLAEDDDAICDK